MKSLKVISVTPVNTEKARKDGKPSRQYYTITFADALNPLKKHSSRTFFQIFDEKRGVNRWNIATPEAASSLIGQTIPGEIVTSAVETYPVLKSDGTQQIDKNGSPVYANKFTVVKFEGEALSDLLKSSGHKIATQSQQSNAEVSNLANEVANLM